MDETYDVAIIGAGPAGLAAATNVKGRAVILERNAQPGKKFLLSGSGQCNVTHAGDVEDFLNHYGDRTKARFIKPALWNFTPQDTVDFFERHGVPMFCRDDGKIFPKSLKSKDLLRVLFQESQKNEVEFQAETTVESIFPEKNVFQIETDQGRISARKVVFSTGGCSYPTTGSKGDGFRIAESLGHRIVPPKPALTPVVVRDFSFIESAGTSFRQTKIELFRNEKRLHHHHGDVLLTHHGLSGPGILDLSRYIEPGDELKIGLVPKDQTEKYTQLLQGGKSLKNALAPLDISERFLIKLLEFLEIPSDRSASEISRSERKKLADAFSGFSFFVQKLGNWNEAMATTGGVALEEVDRQTLQSRLVRGLFFCGEVLDIDGDTGGYNIQFALSSGRLAGKTTAGMKAYSP